MGDARLLAGLGLVLAGFVSLLALTALDRPPPTAHLGSGPTAVSEAPKERHDISAHNTPALARNPADEDNLVVAHRVDQPTYACGLHTSFDGGRSWTETAIPEPPVTRPKCYAPTVAFGADGALYVSSVMLEGVGNTPASVWVTSSADGGRTLSEPVQVTGPLAFQVGLVAHPRLPEHLTLTWLQAETTGLLSLPDVGNPIVMARSDDGGRTWSEPVQVSAASRERVLAPVPAMADGGELFVLYLDVRDDRLNYHGAHEGQPGPTYPGPWELVLARSSDDGRTWTETTVDDALVPVDRYLVFLPPLPSLAVDGQQVYAAFHDARAGDADVWVWASGDAGVTWDPPVRANDNASADGTSQHLPQLAAAPDGRLDLLYYDRRGDPDDVVTEVSLQSSTDGGQTFGARRNLSDVAFSWPGDWSHGDSPEQGSRLALVSGQQDALAVWPDMRGDDLGLGEQTIYFAAVTFDPAPQGARTALGWGGVILLAAGAVLVGWAVLRRRGRRPPPDQPGGLARPSRANPPSTLRRKDAIWSRRTAARGS